MRHRVEHLDAYLAACQVGITLASLGLGVVGKPAFEALLEPLFGEGAAVASIGVAAGLAFFVITLHREMGVWVPNAYSDGCEFVAPRRWRRQASHPAAGLRATGCWPTVREPPPTCSCHGRT